MAIIVETEVTGEHLRLLSEVQSLMPPEVEARATPVTHVPSGRTELWLDIEHVGEFRVGLSKDKYQFIYHDRGLTIAGGHFVCMKEAALNLLDSLIARRMSGAVGFSRLKESIGEHANTLLDITLLNHDGSRLDRAKIKRSMGVLTGRGGKSIGVQGATLLSLRRGDVFAMPKHPELLHKVVAHVCDTDDSPHLTVAECPSGVEGNWGTMLQVLWYRWQD